MNKHRYKFKYIKDNEELLFGAFAERNKPKSCMYIRGKTYADVKWKHIMVT